jgi:hypothetical protein
VRHRLSESSRCGTAADLFVMPWQTRVLTNQPVPLELFLGGEVQLLIDLA